MSRKAAGQTDFHLTGAEIKTIMGCQRAKASQIIVQLNHELAEKGYITISGKIPIRYFCQRVGFDEDEIRTRLGKQ